jgi:hypothetical protein
LLIARRHTQSSLLENYVLLGTIEIFLRLRFVSDFGDGLVLDFLFGGFGFGKFSRFLLESGLVGLFEIGQLLM